MSTAEAMIDVCALSDLVPERGVAALVEGRQVALFLLDDGTVHAVQHHDPYSGANVIARGLVGTHAVTGEDGAEREVPTVSSPMYKQTWNLDTGAVLDAAGGEERPLAVHRAEVREGRVLVSALPQTAPEARQGLEA